MKKTTILTVMVAGLVMQALAANADDNPSASTTAIKKTWPQQVYNYFLQPKTATQTDRIDRVGGVSSRPWAQTAGDYSGEGPSSFIGDRVSSHHAELKLFTLKF